jgi:hypothetical protein
VLERALYSLPQAYLHSLLNWIYQFATCENGGPPHVFAPITDRANAWCLLQLPQWFSTVQVIRLMEGLVTFIASNEGVFLRTLMCENLVHALQEQGAPEAFVNIFTVRPSTVNLYAICLISIVYFLSLSCTRAATADQPCNTLVRSRTAASEFFKKQYILRVLPIISENHQLHNTSDATATVEKACRKS